MAQDIEIHRIDSWPAEDIVRLYISAGWWKDCYEPENLHKLISGSFIFIVAVDPESGRAVGMGRVISDGVSDGYIQDVTVLEDFRGRGIGSEIVKSLLDACNERGLSWIGLIAEKGSNPFYHPLGFKEFDGEPMVYRRKG